MRGRRRQFDSDSRKGSDIIVAGGGGGGGTNATGGNAGNADGSGANSTSYTFGGGLGGNANGLGRGGANGPNNDGSTPGGDGTRGNGGNGAPGPERGLGGKAGGAGGTANGHGGGAAGGAGGGAGFGGGGGGSDACYGGGGGGSKGPTGAVFSSAVAGPGTKGQPSNGTTRAATPGQNGAVTFSWKYSQSQKHASHPVVRIGTTVVNSTRARTKQGVPMNATVTWKLLSARAMRGDFDCRPRVTTGPGRRVAVRVSGACRLRVRVTYTAPGTSAYFPYKKVFSYRV